VHGIVRAGTVFLKKKKQNPLHAMAGGAYAACGNVVRRWCLFQVKKRAKLRKGTRRGKKVFASELGVVGLKQWQTKGGLEQLTLLRGERKNKNAGDKAIKMLKDAKGIEKAHKEGTFRASGETGPSSA